MEFSKKHLLSLIKQNLNEMAMDFDTQDRPSSDLQSKLAQGDTPIKKVPLPKTNREPQTNFQELLASERYRQVIQNLRRYTGNNDRLNGPNGMPPLMQMMGQAHYRILEIERSHKQALEQLAVKLVMDEFGLTEEDSNLIVDAKIVTDFQTNDFAREQGNQPNPEEVNVDNDNEEQPQQNINPQNAQHEERLFHALETLNLERAKRRMINSIIQGAAKRGHYMYHLVEDQVRQITGSNELINLYGIMMSINDTNYWQLTNSQISSVQDSIAGRVQVQFPGGNEEQPEGMEGGEGEEGEEGEGGNDRIKIIARGINFPVLVHELVKGFMEVLGSHGQPEDRELFQQVMQHEDTLEKELWDLRLGPAIWTRLRSQFPEEVLEDNSKELQNYLLIEIFKLPAKRFLVFVKEVISGSRRGNQLMVEMVNSIKLMLQNQDYEESIAKFNEDLEDISDDTQNQDLSDFMSKLGIRLSSDDFDDEDEEDDETLPKR